MMPWTAKVTEVSTDGGNAVAVVEFHNTDNGKLFSDKTWGDTLSLDYLKDWAAKRIESLSSRDDSVESLKSLVGQSLTPEKQEPDSDQVSFLQAVAKRRAYLSLGAEKYASEIATADEAIAQYLSANPDAILLIG